MKCLIHLLFFFCISAHSFSQNSVEQKEKAFAYFDYGKYELTRASQTILDSLLSKVISKDMIQININGYTDSDGNNSYNNKLSQDRTTVVQQYLTSKGIPKDKFKIQYFGESKPASTNDSEDGKQINRRVEIIIIYNNKTELVQSGSTDTAKELAPVIQSDQLPEKKQRLKSFVVSPDKETEIGKVYLEHKEPILCNPVVTVVIVDAGIEDLDTVSIYFNFELIIDRQALKKKSNAACIRVLQLKPGENNSLIAKAWNNGLESINTLKIEIYEGDVRDSEGLLKKNKKPFAFKIMNSKPGLSSAILLKSI